MLDLRDSLLPPLGGTRWEVFHAFSTATAMFRPWQKPRGCSWIFGLVFAAGGGGGRPNTGAVAGAGGGAAGAFTKFLMPALALPDILYISVGTGGLGATANNTAGVGGNSTVISTVPASTSGFNIVQVNGGNGGAAATTGGTGTSATAVNGAYPMWAFGFTAATTSGAGGNGGASGAGGSAVTWASAGIPTCGGGGGGGGNAANTAGGAITGVGPVPTLSGVSAGNGLDGFGFNRPIILTPSMSYMQFCFSGGVGGGASNGGTGGSGGRGAYGCGGGGGGGGVTTGNGGNGGDGLVLMGAW